MPGVMIDVNGKTPEQVRELVTAIQERVRVAVNATFPPDMPEAERAIVHCMLMMGSIPHIHSFDAKLNRCIEIMGDFVVAAALFTPDASAAQGRWVAAAKVAEAAQEAIFQTIQREQNHGGSQLQ